MSARLGLARGVDCVDEVRLGACLWIVGAGVGLGARLWIVGCFARGCGLWGCDDGNAAL